MNLAITGGAGFLGYHLANRLSEKFDKILILDISPIDRSEYPKNTKFFNADVRDFKTLDKIFKNTDFVIHAAAALPLWNKKDILETNIQGTKNVLEAARKNRVKRVVFISSTAVYGIPKKHPVFESDPLSGVGPYGESKIEAEKICKQYREKGMCVPIIRPKTFIGTGRLGVFQILYDWIKNGKKIPIIGNGKNRYQLLEVDDLVDAIYLMLTLPEEKVNDVFNIGAKKFKTIKEDLEELCKYAGTGSKTICIPSFIAKPALELFWLLKISPLYKWVYGTMDKDSFVSIEKAERQLGWKPRCSNAEALIRSYKWYIDHLDEIKQSGVTHRVAWKQGILGFFKKFM